MKANKYRWTVAALGAGGIVAATFSGDPSEIKTAQDTGSKLQKSLQLSSSSSAAHAFKNQVTGAAYQWPDIDRPRLAHKST